MWILAEAAREQKRDQRWNCLRTALRILTSVGADKVLSLRYKFFGVETKRRRRPISNSAIAAATETFSELTFPYKGIRTTKSAVLRTISRIPWPSDPSTNVRRGATSRS